VSDGVSRSPRGRRGGADSAPSKSATVKDGSSVMVHFVPEFVSFVVETFNIISDK